YLRDHRNDSAELLRFFTDLERLAVALMVLRVDVNKRAERYGKLLTEMAKGVDLSLEASALQLSAAERGAVLEALGSDIYDVKFVTRYVLLRLDGLLSEGEAKYEFAVISIEHVLPQNPAPGGE